MLKKCKGCADRIFCAQQLMEKALEHNTTLYLLFIDLRKPYDSIPREALWQVLRKYGIPPTLVNIIRSLHDGMKTEVTMDGTTTPDIEVTNGRDVPSLPPCSICTSTLSQNVSQEEPAFWCGGSLQMWRASGGGENEAAFEDHHYHASVCR